ELILVCVIALVVLGPERLPEALRTLGLWVGRARRSFLSVKAEIEREIGMDDVRRQLHNETIMEDLRKLERDVRGQQAPTIAPPATSSEPGSNGSAAAATVPEAQKVLPAKGEVSGEDKAGR
ncbi:MAG: twin-arginine translocase subunit TatB, partial [Gammaproteobacteria bacterium]|nr:twin-arginine translocase subunit TatB [Gammaproteobacteria bacterium]